MRHDAGHPRISSLGGRTRPPAIACLNYQHLRGLWRERRTLSRMKLLPEYICEPEITFRYAGLRPASRGDAVSLQRGPFFGYRLPTGGRQTDEDKKSPARSRILANLVSALERTPSSDRVPESSPYYHVGGLWRDRQTLFRKKWSSGARFRTRPSVSL